MLPKVKIVPFEYWHLEMMNPQEEQKSVFDYAKSTPHGLEGYGKALEFLAAPQNDGKPCAWTAMLGGRILACSGITRLQYYMGEAWAVFDRDFFEMSDLNIRQCLVRIGRAMRQVELQRVQATTEVGFDRADEFLTRLGFVREGKLKKYGSDGQDHYMYAFVR